MSADLLPVDPHVTPVDHGEVCLNVDVAAFEKRGLAPPSTLEELTLPRYKGLTVVENAATSSPGLAFLLATIGATANGWEGYWRKLRANDVLVVDGWEQAYTQEFSGAAGSPGKRPIVVSYATSPAAEVIFAGKPLDRVADGRGRGRLLPAGRVRGRASRRPERGGRAEADRLPALASASRPTSRHDVRLPGTGGRRAPRGVREARDRPVRSADDGARADRGQP